MKAPHQQCNVGGWRMLYKAMVMYKVLMSVHMLLAVAVQTLWHWWWLCQSQWWLCRCCSTMDVCTSTVCELVCLVDVDVVIGVYVTSSGCAGVAVPGVCVCTLLVVAVPVVAAPGKCTSAVCISWHVL